MLGIYSIFFVATVWIRVIYCDNVTTSIRKSSYREHKIHNIVLYPDKHSWCTPTAIVQMVGHPGCNNVKIDNNVCVGACFSYIVPRTVPDTPGEVRPYCDSCQPERISWKKVILECVEGEYKNQNLTKFVEIIHECSCDTCKISDKPNVIIRDTIDTNLDSDDDSLNDFTSYSSAIDIWSTGSGNSSTKLNRSEGFLNFSAIDRNGDEFKNLVSGVLKKLNYEDENILENDDGRGIHKNVWKNLLEKVESLNNTLDSTTFTRLIKSTEEETKMKFNNKRMKHALLKFKKYQDIAKANAKTEISSSFSSTNTPKDVRVSPLA